MSLPFFYENELSSKASFTLSEVTSKHIIQVLRMRHGGHIQLTNGKGKIITTEIISENKKATEVKVISTTNFSPRTSNVAIAISLVKNNSRFEWFLEKATEIGVSEIIPMICERTEKQTFRHNRMKNILISAMLQSKQAWLPLLHEPVKFKELIKNLIYENRFIAHCGEGEKKRLSHILRVNKIAGTSQVLPIGEDLGGAIIFIGPEGDFTREEIESAKQNNFIPVSLGATRLRTETAGIVACVLFNQK